MTERDMFAMAALQGLIASKPKRNDGKPITYEDIADEAYIYADAMISAREAPDET